MRIRLLTPFIVGIEAIMKELLATGFDGPTTLEIAGEEAVKVSANGRPEIQSLKFINTTTTRRRFSRRACLG